MKEFYKTATSLAEESQKLSRELFKSDPSFEKNGKKSLATLAGIARELEKKYKILRINLIARHGRNQRDEYNRRLYQV